MKIVKNILTSEKGLHSAQVKNLRNKKKKREKKYIIKNLYPREKKFVSSRKKNNLYPRETHD